VRARTRVPKTGRLRSLTDGVRRAGAVCVGGLPAFTNARVMVAHPPRTLTDAKIRRVLEWHAKQQKFLRDNGTVATVARQHGVATGVIYRFINNYQKRAVARTRSRPFGRPGTLSRSQVRAVSAWYEKKQRFLSSHVIVADLAQELRATPSAIYACIRRGYRRPFSNVTPRHGKTSGSVESAVARESRIRSELLRSWRKSGTYRSHEQARPSRGARRGR